MKTLMHFRDFVNEMTTSASRLHKQEVLKKYNLPALQVEKLLDEPELTEAVNKIKEEGLNGEKQA